jgi:DNA modification methylase
MTTQRIIPGDCIAGMRTLPDASVHCCVTSPPYWGLRDYGHDGQIGLESTPEAYVARMVEVFREVRRVLRDDGTLWLNLGDSYAAGKQAAGIPWRVALALQNDQWKLRQEIIWHKPNPMPEGVRDRCTRAHEYVFLLSRSSRYFFDASAISEPAVTGGKKGLGFYPDRAVAMGRKPSGNEAKGPSSGVRPMTRNRRSVWTVPLKPYSGAHFAVMPPDLVEPCIKAGCPERGTVLDPFAGSGTTLAVAAELGRSAIGCELNPDYIALAEERIRRSRDRVPLFA